MSVVDAIKQIENSIPETIERLLNDKGSVLLRDVRGMQVFAGAYTFLCERAGKEIADTARARLMYYSYSSSGSAYRYLVACEEKGRVVYLDLELSGFGHAVRPLKIKELDVVVRGPR